MAHRLAVRTADRTVQVDGRDVAAWAGTQRRPDPDDPAWAEHAGAYVDAHPRAGSRGIAGAQRLAILRRLAAGPATTAELLAAMRTVGWVGSDDLENRLRDLRAGDRRSGTMRAGLGVESRDGRYRLTAPFPALGEPDLRALGFAKAMLGQLHGPLAAGASAALDHLLPGVAAGRAPKAATAYRARAVDFERFEAAREERRGVLVRYFSLNSGREGHYRLVPVEYVTVGATVKAICVRVDEDGRRVEGFDRQFAMDRLLEVQTAEGQPRTGAEAVRLARSRIVLEFSDVLYRVSRQRDLFGLGSVEGVQNDYDDSWRVEGQFPMALSWDVMEQLCAWSGQVQVHEPLWLVNAVVRRLRAGLRVMEEGAGFQLVKPEPERRFADHGEAVTIDEPLPEPTGPRKLQPPRGR
jgi:hypothetical protein